MQMRDASGQRTRASDLLTLPVVSEKKFKPDEERKRGGRGWGWRGDKGRQK